MIYASISNPLPNSILVIGIGELLREENFQLLLLHLCGPDVLWHFVKVAVELIQFGLHHVAAGGSPAGHQDDGLVLDVVHAEADVLQLLQHALTDRRTDGQSAEGRDRKRAFVCDRMNLKK